MKRYRVLIIAFALLLALAGCAAKDEPVFTTEPSNGELYLYGESHGVGSILSQELALWQGYYREQGLRHLFVELPYFTAEYLNLYMRSPDDAILEEIYRDWEGTASQTPAVKDFYIAIKETCPETVFHGTDVGHQYATTGERYLAYLEGQGLQDSEQYKLAKDNIEQGKAFYGRSDYGYRENRMVENFVRAFDALDGESVMGIYGSAHMTEDGTAPESKNVPSMANRLKARYGDALYIETLKEAVEALRTGEITVGEKAYQALYFGRQDLSKMLPNYKSREFWRLEGAYGDLKDCPKTGDYLPYDNYPMQVSEGEVYVIDYTLTDGTVQRKYYRSDGNRWQDRPATEEFVLE